VVDTLLSEGIFGTPVGAVVNDMCQEVLEAHPDYVDPLTEANMSEEEPDMGHAVGGQAQSPMSPSQRSALSTTGTSGKPANWEAGGKLGERQDLAAAREASPKAQAIWKSLQDLNRDLKRSAADDGAMQPSDLAYQKRMLQAEGIRVKFERQLREQGMVGCLVQHDVYQEGPVGITLNPEARPHDYADISELKKAATFHGNLAAKVAPGMYLCAVGEFDCDDKSVVEIAEAIKHSPRPVTLTFALPDLTQTSSGHIVDDLAIEDVSAGELQIQCVVNALQKQVRHQSVQVRHLRHAMLEREKSLEKHASQIATIVQAVAGQADMQWYDDAASSHPKSEHPPVFESLLALDKALRKSSGDDLKGGEEPKDLVYQGQMAAAEKLRLKYEAALAKDGITGCLIQHDVYSSVSLGIELNDACHPKDYADITAISREAVSSHGNMAQKIHPGMTLCAVGDFDCDDRSVAEISAEMHHAPRPVTLTCALPTLTLRVGEYAGQIQAPGTSDSEELQIQCVVNALQKQVREQQVELKHLQHEMSQRTQRLDAHFAQIEELLRLVEDEHDMHAVIEELKLSLRHSKDRVSPKPAAASPKVSVRDPSMQQTRQIAWDDEQGGNGKGRGGKSGSSKGGYGSGGSPRYRGGGNKGGGKGKGQMQGLDDGSGFDAKTQRRQGGGLRDHGDNWHEELRHPPPTPQHTS